LPRVCCGTPHDLQLLRVPAEVNSHQVVMGVGRPPPRRPTLCRWEPVSLRVSGGGLRQAWANVA
jgi:hypothetical protein